MQSRQQTVMNRLNTECGIAGILQSSQQCAYPYNISQIWVGDMILFRNRWSTTLVVNAAHPNGAKVLSDPNTTPHLAVRNGIRFGQSFVLIENVWIDLAKARHENNQNENHVPFLFLLFHFRNTSSSFFFGRCLNVKDIIASNQDFAQETGKLSVDELFTSS
jgi:hypothetical protein